MKLALKILSAAVMAVLLSSCGSSDSASFLIRGAPHSLSLLREKQYLWSSEWDLSLVSSNNPECMRRHKLQPVPDGEFKVELFRSLEGNYILKQGNNWYVTETQKCRLQQFQSPPREPGDSLGSFEVKEGILQFVPSSNPVAPPAATPPGATAAPR